MFKILFYNTSIIVILMMVTSLKAFSHDFEYEGIFYNILNSTEVVVTYKGNNFNQFKNEYSGNVEIPEKIVCDGAEYTVTSIGNHSFRDCTELVSVSLPNSLKIIGKSSFMNCKNLTRVLLPKSLTSVGDKAFWNCIRLDQIEVPNEDLKIRRDILSDRTVNVYTDYRNCLILAYSPVNNIYEDDNIKLEIYDEQLWASNKTNETIFIDLSRCFLINNGSAYPILGQQNSKKTSSAGVTTSDGTFLAIAPKIGSNQNETVICRMSTILQTSYSTSESVSQNFSDYDLRFLNIIGEMVNESLEADPKGKKCIGTVSRHLTEDESISNIGASIAYSFSKSDDNWTTVTLTTWVSDVIFAPYYVEMPKELSKRQKQGFGIKKTDPAYVVVKADSPFEFDEDRSPLIVSDWEGDFEKGEFTLTTTRIEKKKKSGAVVALAFASIFTGGVSAAFIPHALEEVSYKSVLRFAGKDAYWGKMYEAKKISNTGRDIIDNL